MSFPRTGTPKVGIDTAGDMSGAAYNADGSAKVEWGDMLSNAYDGASGTLKVSVGSVSDGAITNSKLAANAVTTDKILDGTIVAADLGTGTVKQVKGTVTWNGAATQAIATLPAGSILLQAVAVCTAAFDGNTPSPAVTVGYTGGGNGAKIITAPTLTLNAVSGEAAGDLGADLFSTTKRVKFYAAQTVVNGYLTAGGSATAGSLDVYLIYVQTAAGVV